MKTFRPLLVSAVLIIVAAGSIFAIKNVVDARRAGDAGKECAPIEGVPFKIKRRGTYCLVRDVEVSGDGIMIDSDFVTLDLKGHVLRGPLDRNTSSVGIGSTQVSNVRITNGRVEGFGAGIVLISNTEDPRKGFNQIDRVVVARSRQSGIKMFGNFNRLMDSEVREIGGGVPPRVLHTHGILSAGPGAIIVRNEIYEVRGDDVDQKAEGIAIALTGAPNGSLVANNKIGYSSIAPSRNSSRWAGRSPSTFGVWAGGDGMSNVAISDNTIENAVNGVILDTHASGVVSGNKIRNTAVPLSERGPHRFEDRIASGSNGYQPSARDSLRPFGVVVFSANECGGSDSITASLAKTKKDLGNCVVDSDVSFDEVVAFLAKQ